MPDVRTDAHLDLLADNVLPTRRREEPAWRVPPGDLAAPVMLLSPEAVNTDIPRLQAVTAADVLRVMKKYFTDNNRVVIYYQNEGGAK